MSRDLPDYLGDRNAMHDAVSSLTDEEFDKYHMNLLRTAEMGRLNREMLLPSLERMASAYLEAKGLWTT